MTKPGRVLFLHGASSSGKSTLADALRQNDPVPWLHLSIDHLRDSKAWNPARYTDWPAARPRFFEGFHNAVAGFARAGNDVLLEHILDTHGWHSQLQTLLWGCPVLFVGLHTDLTMLNQREASRDNRTKGSAAADFATVHQALIYDLTLDGSAPPVRNATRIQALLADPPILSRFFEGHQTNGIMR